MAQGKLKKLAVAGIAALALTHSFNLAAQSEAETTPAADASQQINTAPAAHIAETANDNQAKVAPHEARQYDAVMTARLVDQLVDMEAYMNIDRRRSNPGFDPSQDDVAHQMLDLIEGSIEKGADPNFIDPETHISVFGWATWMAYELNRPEVVDTFLAHGADASLKLEAPVALPQRQKSLMRSLRFPQPSANRPMVMIDHAVIGVLYGNYDSRRRLDTGVHILKSLKDHGATYQDSQIVGRAIDNDLDFAQNIVSLTVLKEKGLISEKEYEDILGGSEELKARVEALEKIDSDLLQQIGASLSDYPDAIPGGPEPYSVQENDTLHSVASRFEKIMGASSTQDAIEKIAALNDIDLSGPADKVDLNAGPSLEKGQVLLIPQPADTQIVTFTLRRPVTINDLVENIKDSYYRPGYSADRIAEEILDLNGMDVGQYRDQGRIIDRGTKLTVPMSNRDYRYVNQLVPPKDYNEDNKVYLFVSEPNSSHQRQTYTAAANTAYGINRDTDFSLFHALNEGVWSAYFAKPNDASEALRVLQHPDNPLQDNIVFSSSASLIARGLGREEGQMDARRLGRYSDHIQGEIQRIQKDRVEKASPIIFNAAGNDHPGRGDYAHHISDLHSSRSTFVGGVGRYPAYGFPGNRAEKVIAPYSEYGSNICATLPPYIGTQMEGTSFSTPATAAIYRQFAEWYGDKLTFEEIMAAGLMTADRDLLQYEDVDAVDQMIKGKARYDISKFTVKPAEYDVNAAGLPINDMCGAGAINPYQWNETLKIMASLKQEQNLTTDYHAAHIYTGDAAAIDMVEGDDGKPQIEYEYHVKMPHDMTLDKLTFFVPQSRLRHSPITVTSPGGFSYQLSKSTNDTLTTEAFSYEDVKAGDILVLRTEEPLADDAGVMLRGHKGTNVVQKMRDYLRDRGVLAQPLTQMTAKRAMPEPWQPKAQPGDDVPANENQPVSLQAVYNNDRKPEEEPGQEKRRVALASLPRPH